MSADLRSRYLGLELRNPVVASASPLTGLVPAFNVFDLPFIITSEKAADAIYDGPIGAKLAADLEAKGINVGGEYAYAIVPVNVTIRSEGRQGQSHLGVLTVALQRIDSVWRINALTYSPQ